jgi:NADH dehydrogenase/NADH:ubiquinone oxidoreductase subunit G
MISLKMNGLDISVEKGTTLLEAAKFYGFPIPTLCYMEGLSPYGACRLCVVEIGEGPKAKLVTSCTYPVEEGLVVRTASSRVVRARKMIIELLLASCPQSKTIQDLASAYGVSRQRFRQEHEDCILCGRCVRVCKEQMMAGAIGFHGRGCTYPEPDKAICGACANLEPPCLEKDSFDDRMCFLDPCLACEIRKEVRKEQNG